MKTSRLVLGAALLSPTLVHAQSVVLYGNDFETPNVAMAVSCGNSLDQRTINALFGTEGFQFTQTNTVEGLFINDPAGLYENPQNQGGEYAIGMLSTAQDDQLALTLDGGRASP